MKRLIIPTIGVLMVLIVAYIALGQDQEQRRQRWAQRREAQIKAIEAIQEHAAKLKAGMEESAGARENWRELSDDERTKLREQFRQRREEHRNIINAMEEQITMLKGSRQLRSEHEESIRELKELLALAQKENASETAKRLEELITNREEKFEQMLQKFGFGQRP